MGGRITPAPVRLVRYAESNIITPFGTFRIVVYRRPCPSDTPISEIEEHVALYQGDLAGTTGVFTRIHSECFTGEVVGSMSCDCREQLDQAMERIAEEGRGVVVYLRQEGRGIGLGNKIRAYQLQQEGGRDTVEANEDLGFRADLRSFELAAEMLTDLEVRSVRLNTNNTQKIAGLEAAGIPVTERVPSESTMTPHNRAYLATKRERLGHLLNDSAGANTQDT